MLDHLPPPGPFDARDWQNILAFIIRPPSRHTAPCPTAAGLALDDDAAWRGRGGPRGPDRDRDSTGSSTRPSRGPRLGRQPSVGEHRHPPIRVDTSAAATPRIAHRLHVTRSLQGSLEDVCRWLFPAARHYFDNMHSRAGMGDPPGGGERKVASSSVSPRFDLECQLPDGVVPARAVDDALAQPHQP